VKIITIITPANIEVEYKLAGVGARLAAFIIDTTLQFLSILLCGGIIWGAYRFLANINAAPRAGTMLAIWMVINFVIHFGYFIVCEMVMNGQSIGKRLFGLRVIRDNGQPIEFPQALIRGIIRSSLDMLYFGLFVIMFSKKHKRVGDMAAGTIVVIEKYDSNYEPSLAIPETGLPDFLPPLIEMTRQERDIVEDWLRRRDKLPKRGVDIAQSLKYHFESKGYNYGTAE